MPGGRSLNVLARSNIRPADAVDNVVQRVKFRRDILLTFFEHAGRAIVRMEARSGSQGLARKLQAMGHTIRVSYAGPICEAA